MRLWMVSPRLMKNIYSSSMYPIHPPIDLSNALGTLGALGALVPLTPLVLLVRLVPLVPLEPLCIFCILSDSVFLSTFLFIYPSVSICPSSHLSIRLSTISIYLSTYLICIYLCMHISTYVSVCPWRSWCPWYISASIYPPTSPYLSIYLSIYLLTFCSVA